MATALNSMDMPPSIALGSTTVSVVEALDDDSTEEEEVVVAEVEMSAADVAVVDGIVVVGATSKTVVVHGGAGAGVGVRYWAICRSLRRKPDFS